MKPKLTSGCILSGVGALLSSASALSAQSIVHETPLSERGLVDNIATYSRKISTTSPFGYYLPEAIASFEDAQQYDQDHPMLDWGLALAMGPNPNSRKKSFPDDPHDDGNKAIANARAHLPRATMEERALIEALSVRFDTDQFRIAPRATKNSSQPLVPSRIVSRTTWKLNFCTPIGLNRASQVGKWPGHSFAPTGRPAK